MSVLIQNVRPTVIRQAGSKSLVMIAQPQQDSVGSGEEMEAALAEVRQLIADLRDAAQDGRDLARRYSAVLQTVVDEYCNEFELRANSALAKLEAAR